MRLEDGLKGGNKISPIELEGFGQDERSALAEIAKEDLYVMAKAILGYSDVTHRAHKELCDEVCDSSNPRKLILMPRGHFKTSVVTISNPIRVLANDQTEQILIVNESSENAEDMLGEITGHFRNNETFRTIFPSLIPDSFGRAWTASAITIPRKGSHRHSSVEAAGINSKLTSRHHTYILADDLIAEAARESLSVMQKAIKFVNRMTSLLVNQVTDPIHVIGTRWAFSDIYSYILDHYPEFKPFIRKAIVHGPEGPEPLFPEKFTMEYFAGIIRRDPEHWANNFANDPLDTSAIDFDPAWLQYFTFTKDRDLYIVDETGHRYIQSLHELNIYMMVDPSIGEDPHHDYTGITIVGLSPYKQVYLLDAWAGRIDSVKTTNKILELNRFWHPKRVIIESNAYQKALGQWVQERARERQEYIRIVNYPAPSTKKKKARIRGALGPLFSNRRFWIRDGLVDFVEEYLGFGKREHEHLLDSAAMGKESGVWKYPAHARAIQRRIAQRDEITRDLGVTGYGA